MINNPNNLSMRQLLERLLYIVWQDRDKKIYVDDLQRDFLPLLTIMVNKIECLEKKSDHTNETN